MVRDHRYHRHGRRARCGGQPEGRVPVRLAASGGCGSRTHRRGRRRRGLRTDAEPGGQHEGRDDDGRASPGGDPPGFAESRAATPLSPRSPAAHPTTLAPPATRRAYSLPITRALTARHTLALTDCTIAVTDLTPVITGPSVTITPVAYITRALTDLTITNAYFTRALTDTNLTLANIPVTDTFANTHLSVTIAHLTVTNAHFTLAGTHLPVTLGIVLNPVLVTDTRRIAATDPGPAVWSPASNGRRERQRAMQVPSGVSGHLHGQSAGRLCPGDALVRLLYGRTCGG